MRIAFLTSVFSFGGAQMSSIELAARLGSSHEIRFFDTNGSSDPFIDSLTENSIPFSLLSEHEQPFIINKYKFKPRNIFRYFNYFFKWNKTRLIVHRELLHYQPDIVTIYDDRSLSYLWGLNNKTFKIWYYARGWYTSDQMPLKMRFLLKRLPDIIICISESTRQAMYCGGIAPLDKMYVIHNSINKERLRLKIETIKGYDKDFKIIHSGGFLPSKGQHIALEAALILKERMVDFHLFICGIIYPGLGEQSRQYFEDLKNFVELNKLEPFVSFIVGKSNIISYIDYCDIMFFPSSSEGLPRSIMEAMALGKPVIANAVGGVTDLILDRFTGYITKYNNPEEYADIAELFYKDVSLYKEISSNASHLIESSFTESMQIKKTEELLKLSLASGSK